MVLQRLTYLAELGGHGGLLGQILTGQARDLLLELGELCGCIAVVDNVRRMKMVDAVADGVQAPEETSGAGGEALTGRSSPGCHGHPSHFHPSKRRHSCSARAILCVTAGGVVPSRSATSHRLYPSASMLMA